MQSAVEQALLALGAILACARLLGGIAVRFRQPRIGAEMLAGLLVGSALLAPWRTSGSPPHHVAVLARPANDFVAILGQFGVLLFLCLVGLTVAPHDLRCNQRKILRLSLAVVLGAVALAPLGAEWFAGHKWQLAHGALRPSLVMAAALMISGFPVVARVLQERNELHGNATTVILGTSSVLTAVPFILLAVAEHQFRSVDLDALLYVASLVAAGTASVLAAFAWPRLAAHLHGPALSEGSVLAVAVIAVLIAGWLSSLVFRTPLLGGFAVGVALSQSPRARAVLQRTLGAFVPTILVPIFLAAAGARIDLRLLDVRVFEGAAVFTILLVAVAAVGTLAQSGAPGTGTHNRATTMALLNCRGLMLLAVGVEMASHRLAGARLVAVFFIGAVTTTLMTGPLLDWGERSLARQELLERASPHDPERVGI